MTSLWIIIGSTPEPVYRLGHPLFTLQRHFRLDLRRMAFPLRHLWPPARRRSADRNSQLTSVSRFAGAAQRFSHPPTTRMGAEIFQDVLALYS